jgi:hypothetical protein
MSFIEKMADHGIQGVHPVPAIPVIFVPYHNTYFQLLIDIVDVETTEIADVYTIHGFYCQHAGIISIAVVFGIPVDILLKRACQWSRGIEAA